MSIAITTPPVQVNGHTGAGFWSEMDFVRRSR
jgi:hypothetical protein